MDNDLGYTRRKFMVERQLYLEGLTTARGGMVDIITCLDYNLHVPRGMLNVAQRLFRNDYRIEHMNPTEWRPMIPCEEGLRPERYFYKAFGTPRLPHPFIDGFIPCYERLQCAARRHNIIDVPGAVSSRYLDWDVVATCLYTFSEENRAIQAYYRLPVSEQTLR